LRTAQRGLRS